MSRSQQAITRRQYRKIKSVIGARYLPVSETMHFLKYGSVVHGKITFTDKKTKKLRQKPQTVAMILIDPDTGNIHFHYLCHSKKVARKIATSMPRKLWAWVPGNSEFNQRKNTYSWGVKESFHKDPVFFHNQHFRHVEWQGRPSSKYVGPYWPSKAEKADADSEMPKSPYVDILDRSVRVDDVSTMLIDTSEFISQFDRWMEEADAHIDEQWKYDRV